MRVLLAAKDAEERFAIQTLRRLSARGLDARRQDVDPTHHRGGSAAWFDASGPCGDQRRADAGVVGVPLAERELRPVIAGEEEQRVFPEVLADCVVYESEITIGV